MATWCSPEGRVSCVICEAELTRDGSRGSRRSRGSRGFLSPSVECCCANGASDDVCKSVHEPGHAGTHPHPLAQTVPCIVWCLVAARIWRHVLELCMWERYPRECSLVTQIGLSWLLPCIVTTGGGAWQGLPQWILFNYLIRRKNIKPRWGKWSRTAWTTVCTFSFELTWEVVSCIAKKRFSLSLKTVIAEQSVS